ncbi:MAG: tetratricopeptide repeat protein [Vicinamibacterales bacterium]
MVPSSRRCLPLILAGALCLAWTGNPVRAQQRSWVLDWLNEYASGQYEDVAQRFRTVADPGTLEKDLDDLIGDWLKQGGANQDDRRRIAAAFALEAAYARVETGERATKLLEWGCRQIRRIPRARAGEFEHTWHLAAFAVMAGAVDPDAIESHIGHMKFQFPDEARLPFERAVAAELRAAPFFEDGKASADTIRKRYEEAAKRYRAVTGEGSAHVEANIRLAHVELELGHPDAALAALDELPEDAIAEPTLGYLSKLLRGRALDRLGRPDDAIVPLTEALLIQPGAQSATIALASVHFRQGRGGVADRLMAQLLARPTPAQDPWWFYWPADFRYITGLVPAMRTGLTHVS